jgi:hypothetical protein
VQEPGRKGKAAYKGNEFFFAPLPSPGRLMGTDGRKVGNHRSQLPKTEKAGPDYVNALTVFGFQAGHDFLCQTLFLIGQTYDWGFGIFVNGGIKKHIPTEYPGKGNKSTFFNGNSTH